MRDCPQDKAHPGFVWLDQHRPSDCFASSRKLAWPAWAWQAQPHTCTVPRPSAHPRLTERRFDFGIPCTQCTQRIGFAVWASAWPAPRRVGGTMIARNYHWISVSILAEFNTCSQDFLIQSISHLMSPKTSMLLASVTDQLPGLGVLGGAIT